MSGLQAENEIFSAENAAVAVRVEVDETILLLKEVPRVAGRLMERYLGAADKGICRPTLTASVIGGPTLIAKDLSTSSVLDS